MLLFSTFFLLISAEPKERLRRETSCGWFCNLGKHTDWFMGKAQDAIDVGVNAVVDTADTGVNAVSDTVEKGVIYTHDKIVEGAEAAGNGIDVVKEEAAKIGAKIKEGVSDTGVFIAENAPAAVESVKEVGKKVGNGAKETFESVATFFGNLFGK